MPREADMSRIIPRKEWGARYGAGWTKRPMPTPAAYLHHTTTVQPPIGATFDQDAAAVRQLDQIGYDRFKGTGGEKAGISYTYVIAPSGRIFAGHDADREGSHTRGHNRTAVGIALIGTFTREAPTQAQLDACAWLLRELHTTGVIANPALTGGHRDTSATECPGAKAYPLIRQINTAAKEAPMTIVDELERDLRARGFTRYCGPTDNRSGACKPGRHGHGKGSAHWDGLGLDVGFDPVGGPAVSRWERAHLDALVREVLADPKYKGKVRAIWNRGPGDHDDHAHFDTQLYNGNQVRYTGVTGVTLDPRAFPRKGSPGVATLRIGDRGAAVKSWQNDLRNVGYDLTADGVFGRDTLNDTLAFQRTRGLVADGIVGANTRAAMAKALKPAPKPTPKPKPNPKAPTLRSGSKGAAVKALQSGLLRVFPDYAGPIRTSGGADGSFGPGTQRVVIEFQRRSNLTPDGVVGAKTWAALAKHGITP